MIKDLEQIANDIAASRTRLSSYNRDNGDNLEFITEEVKRMEDIEFQFRKIITNLKDITRLIRQ